MAACKNAEQVFKHFIGRFPLDGDGELHLVALFAFSLVEKDRVEWMEHCRELNKNEPNPQEIERWYSEKTSQYFGEMEDKAYGWTYGFARALLADEHEAEKKAAVESSVVQELRKIRAFWPKFWESNIFGITSNIAFALVLIAVVIVVNNDVSITGWIRNHVGSPTSANTTKP